MLSITMTTKNAHVALAEALVGLSHHVLHLFADAGREHNLSQQQVELICAVLVRGKIGMTELGRKLHVEKSNLSNLADRLEQRGLARRTRDPDDRRATQIELTPEGVELAMRSYENVTRRTSQLLGRLSRDDQEHLAEVVQQLVAQQLVDKTS